MGERESIENIYTVGGGKMPWYVKIGIDRSDSFYFIASIYEAFRLRYESWFHRKNRK